MAHRKDGTAYLTTVYKKPLEDCNNVDDLRQLVEPYGIDISKDVENDIEFRHIKEVCEGIMEVKDRFPKLKSLVTKLKVFDSEELNPLRTDIDGNIEFHYRYMRKGHSVLDKRMAMGKNLKRFNGLVTARDLAYHEMGHVILSHLCQHNPELWNNNVIAIQFLTKLVSRINNNSFNLEKESLNMSNYAGYSACECVSEGLRDVLQNKDKAKDLSKMIYRQLEEEIN